MVVKVGDMVTYVIGRHTNTGKVVWVGGDQVFVQVGPEVFELVLADEIIS